MKKREISPKFLSIVKSGNHIAAAKEYLSVEAGVRYCPGHARCVHLAYAYLRSQPYRVVEPTANPIEKSIGKHAVAGFGKAIAATVTAASKESLVPLCPSEDEVAAWMSEPEPEDRKVKRLAKETASKVARAARREAQRLEMGMETR